MSTSRTLSTTSARAGSSTACSTPSPSRRGHSRHCEERSDAAIQRKQQTLDCFATLAMTTERQIIARLRRIATAPQARGLLRDGAGLDGLVITHDSIAEGIHFLSTDPPASVGWKLVAVNLSDLAAKGATPHAALLSLTITGPGGWEDLFLSGVEAACESYALPLIG